MTSLRVFAISLSAVCAACGCSAQTTTPATHLTGSALGGKLHVPDGMQVSVFASSIPGARMMALAPDGSVYVSEAGRGDVVRLTDSDGNGEAEAPTVVLSGLKEPHGLAFHDGWLYVANTDEMVRVRLDASGKAVGSPEKVASYSGGGSHSSRTVVFGADGGMYVSVGSTCNLCVEQSDDRATVLRFDADGGGRRVFSTGLRNAVGVAVNPATKEIWVTQNERDNIPGDHQDLPPEEINILRDGGDYGWPYCYGSRIPNPEYHDAARCARTVPPALEMQAHSAPLGIAFLDRATKLPAEYRGDALVAFHGSWNRDVPTGAKVVRIRVKDGKPVGYEDFITGWQDAGGKRWGRPVDVLVAKDGSVLISDDAAGQIYRVWK